MSENIRLEHLSVTYQTRIRDHTLSDVFASAISEIMTRRALARFTLSRAKEITRRDNTQIIPN